jgi:ABC-type branched-subunit amino acid transport system substrate-binding protein
VNAKKIPHIFIASGASKWADPVNFPWSMGWTPNYRSEARVYGRHILKNYPGKTIGILYQNDDLGKDYLAGLNDVLGAQASKLIVASVPYEVSSPTIDSQVVQMKAANPDILLNIASPKFAAQAIKKIGELNWKPIQFLSNVSVSVSTVLKPAGFQYSQDILSAAYLKDPNDPAWTNDAGMNEWRAFMIKYFPEGDRGDVSALQGYAFAQSLVQVLKQCGDDLTRANIMKQMANVDMEIGVYLPGIKIKTGPQDFVPIDQLQIMKFKGESWELFGPLIDGSAPAD